MNVNIKEYNEKCTRNILQPQRWQGLVIMGIHWNFGNKMLKYKI